MRKGGLFLKCLVVGTLMIFFFGWITFLLWNWLVPSLFGGPAITFWQSLGLLLLTKILFFGLGGRRSWSSHYKTHQQHWKHRFYEKISSMTPEEREALKKKMKDKWCTPPSSKDTE
jgi:hypothetical protein